MAAPVWPGVSLAWLGCAGVGSHILGTEGVMAPPPPPPGVSPPTSLRPGVGSQGCRVLGVVGCALCEEGVVSIWIFLAGVSSWPPRAPATSHLEKEHSMLTFKVHLCIEIAKPIHENSNPGSGVKTETRTRVCAQTRKWVSKYKKMGIISQKM